MAAKAISAWCVGTLVAGSCWIGAHSALAAEPSAAANEYEQMQQMPYLTTPQTVAGSQPTANSGRQTPAAAAASNGATVAGDEDYLGFSMPLGPPGRFWARADYLMWFTSGMHVPALVTTSSAADAGILGKPTTTVLYGDATMGDAGRSGVHATVGMWLDCCHRWGVEIDYLTLGDWTSDFSASSSDFPVLARPYYDVTGGTGAQSSQLVSLPGTVNGSVNVKTTDGFQAAGVTFTRSLGCCDSCCDSCCNTCDDPCGTCEPPMLYGNRTDLLVGFRYYELTDSTCIGEDLALVAPSSTIAVQDNFAAKNEFYGTEVGLKTTLYHGRWSLGIAPKIAMGANHETVTIDGSTVVTSGSSTVRYSNGVLATNTNSGTYQRDAFAVIPQLNLEVGYQLTCCWRAFVGYNVLYWGDIARSGDAIDLTVDTKNIPSGSNSAAGGLPFPGYDGKTTAFWAQGVNIGTEFRF